MCLGVGVGESGLRERVALLRGREALCAGKRADLTFATVTHALCLVQSLKEEFKEKKDKKCAIM